MSQTHKKSPLPPKAQAKPTTRQKPAATSPPVATTASKDEWRPLTAPLTHLQLAPNQDKTAVRQNILNWQKVAGNRAVTQAIQRQSRSPAAVADLAAQPVVQREYSEYDYTTQVTTPMRVVVTLGKPGKSSKTIQIKNYSDLSDAYDELGTAMFFDRSEFFPDTWDNEHYEEWGNFEDDVRHYTRWYHKQPASDAPYIAEVKDMQKKMGDGRKLALKCRQSFLKKDEQFKKELGKARSKALAAEKETKQLLRMKFLSGENGGDTTTAFLWTMTDHLFTFSGTVADAMQLPYMQALAAGKLIPGAVTLANVVVNWTSKSPMLMGSALEGLADLNNAVALAGAANSLFVNPGYLVTAYVGPMLNAIVGMMGKLQARLIERNDEAAAFLGVPLYINAEPGGAPLWNYMVTAMRASSSADISPPSGAIFKYFDKFRERFDEFGESKYKGELASYKSGDRDKFPTKAGAIPTESSYWVFTDVNAKKFPGWLFKNRQMVWTLLYGARDPQKAKLTTEK
jgi:hypothetical protein